MSQCLHSTGFVAIRSGVDSKGDEDRNEEYFYIVVIKPDRSSPKYQANLRNIFKALAEFAGVLICFNVFRKFSVYR